MKYYVIFVFLILIINVILDIVFHTGFYARVFISTIVGMFWAIAYNYYKEYYQG
jgi:hypothetical protein